MKMILLNIVLIIFSSITGTNYSCTIPIYIEEYGYIEPKKWGDFKFSLQENRYCEGKLYDCMGQMDIEIYRKDSTLECRGSFINSLDTLKGYSYEEDIVLGKMTIKVIKFFKPLRDGTWYFYDKKGKIIDKKEFKQGIPINTDPPKKIKRE